MSRRDRVLHLVPTLVVGVPFLYFLVDRFDSVSSALRSTRGVLVIVGLAVAWTLLGRVVLPRLTRNAWAHAAAMSMVGLALVWVLVVGSYRDKTVIERFPVRAASPASAPPVVLATGTLRGVGHDATGIARLYRRPDGSVVVGLEHIDIEAGPDYFVWLVPGSNRTKPDRGTNLGHLRGNKGTQYYAVSAATRVDDTVTVLVWCRAFGVPVAHATPS